MASFVVRPERVQNLGRLESGKQQDLLPIYNSIEHTFIDCRSL